VAGSILYDGVLYKNIFMKYDELRDMIVIWYNNDAMQLLNEKVSNFKLQDHSFVRLVKDNRSKELSGTGFYEELYAGRASVYKKTVKNIMEKTDINDGISRSIDQKTFFYLKTTGGYIAINNKADLVDALKDHKNEIKKFVSSQNLNFKKDPDGFLRKIAAYYDTL
jgi:hypothetical protein